MDWRTALKTREAFKIKEVAEFLGVSESGVRRAIKAGEIPSFRVGPRTIRVPAWWLREIGGVT